MIEWSLLAAAASQAIGSAVIAAPAGSEDAAAQALRSAGLEGEVIAGGPSRAQSVRLALEAVRGETVVIHDAARPLVAGSLFDAVVGMLAAEPGADGAIAAAPITDTVKRGSGPRPPAGEPEPTPIAETLGREWLWAAQTPQAFRLEPLRAAQGRAAEEGTLGAATDEAALIEAAGGGVMLVPAPAGNLKVTTPGDLRTAEALLGAAGRV